jgi:hypothetical protein
MILAPYETISEVAQVHWHVQWLSVLHVQLLIELYHLPWLADQQWCIHQALRANS